jgi:hypothetical protein
MISGSPANVLDYGASPSATATANTTAIQAALDENVCVVIPAGQYNVNAAIFPNTGNRLYFEGSQLVATQIITTDECVIKVVDASNVEIHGANINCGSFAANSGIIVRENAALVSIFNTRVENAVWDAVRGGGRAIIIEDNTGETGRIIVDGLIGQDVDTLIGIFGSTGFRKNAIIVNNAIGVSVNKLIALFGDSSPTDGEWQQCIITNVVGYYVAQPIRFAPGASAIIDNVYIFNDAAYGATDGSVIRGAAQNVRCTNIVMEGDTSAAYDVTPWLDDGSLPADTRNTEKCHFQVTIKGTTQFSAVISYYSRAGNLTNTTFDIKTGLITGDTVVDNNVGVNNTNFIEFYSTNQNARMSGYSNSLGGLLITDYANNNYYANASFPAATFVPTIIGTTTAGTASYSVQQGNYTKIGNRVFFNCYVAWSGHTGTGNMQLSGPPFTSNATANTQSALSISFINNISLTAGNIPSAYFEVNSQRVVFSQTPTGGGAAVAVPLDVEGAIMVSGSYLAIA